MTRTFNPDRALFLLLASLAAGGCESFAQAPGALADAAQLADLAALIGGGGDGGACVNPVATAHPASPMEFGATELANALAEVKASHCVRVFTVDDPTAQLALSGAVGVEVDPHSPESFAVFPSGDVTVIVGGGAVGAMYGQLELAERLRVDGPSVLPWGMKHGDMPLVRGPRLPIRASNLFIGLPTASETSWWFQDLGFWRDYLDLMARSRMNFLDLHGMFNMDNVLFPNALLYFAESASYPAVGIALADRVRNRQMLQTIVTLAATRGVQVGMMSYSAETSLTGTSANLINDETALSTFTREAARNLAANVPGLSRIGFRIGESGREVGWYNQTFVKGLEGTGVGVYTRTWKVHKPDILSVVAVAGHDLVVEVKYNGEQWGTPYLVAGGALIENGNAGYSYEDFLDPPADYQLVFQIRSGGTHRMFREVSLDRIRRTVASVVTSKAQGFTLEPTHAFFPQRDYYHADAKDVLRPASPWTFHRDELEYLMFGRLAYDPTVDDRFFRAELARRVGTDALWDAVQAASDVVPWIQSANTCGPDHRDFAPEFELGGPVGYWITPPGTVGPASDPNRYKYGCEVFSHYPPNYHGPFDTFAIAPPLDAAADLINGRGTSRLSPIDVAQHVLADARAARAAAKVAIDPTNAEARDVQRECIALADLAEFWAHKMTSAAALAVYAGTGSADYLSASRDEIQLAATAWKALASDTAYIKPFQEVLRMSRLDLPLFHWKLEIPRLADDLISIDKVVADVNMVPPNFQGTLPPARSWLGSARSDGPQLDGIDPIAITPRDPTAPSWQAIANFASPPPAGATVNILWKPFSAMPTDDWQTFPATGRDTHYAATVIGTGEGGLFAVEVVSGPGASWRYPDPFVATPYVTLAPRP